MIKKHKLVSFSNFIIVQCLMMTTLLIFFSTQALAEDDLWADLESDSPSSQTSSGSTQESESQKQFAEPPIQMWEIAKATDRYRQRPPADTFQDFRQGSIDFWVKYDPKWDSDSDSDSDSGTIVALSNGYDTLFELSMSAEGDAIFMANAEDDAVHGERSRRNAVTFDFNDGLIHHVALVTNDNLTKMYVDGRSAGEFSVGYAIPEDAQGQRQDLQLAVGSLDGIANKFQGQIGGLRIWGVPLDGKLLFKAAFMRDDQLLNQAWAKSMLIAHMDNYANRKTKPKLNILPSFYRPEGVWMSPESEQRKLADGSVNDKLDINGIELNFEFKPQIYTQLIFTDRNSDLGKYAGANQGATKAIASAPNATRNQNKTAVNSVKQTRSQSNYAPIGFTKRANTTIHGQKLAIKRVGIEQCAQMCRDNTQCVAFTFEPKKFDCSITANTSMVVSNQDRDSYFINRGASSQLSANNAASSDKSGYTKLPGKLVLGRLLQSMKIDFDTCAEACSGTDKCTQFTYVRNKQLCQLVKYRNGLATVTSADTYVKSANGNQQQSVAQVPAEQSQPMPAPAVATELKSPLAVQAPNEPITNKDLPVLVRLTFNPYQADKVKGTPEQVFVEAFEPSGHRNQYQSVTNRHPLVITSTTRMYEHEPRFSQTRVSLQAKPKKTDAFVGDVFIVGNQLRSKGSILTGFDPINLDPFDFAKPVGGAKAQIFEHSKYGFKDGANRVVPLGLDLIDRQTGRGRVKTKEVTTEAQMQEMLGGNVSLTAEVDTVKGGATFSGNARFKSITSNMNSGTSAYTFAQEHHVRFTLLIDKAKVGLTTTFREAVELAAQRPSASSAMQLVREFGSHYAHTVTMGGRITQLTELDKIGWGAAQTYEGGVGAAVEARIGPQGVMGGKVAAEGAVEASEMQSFNNQVSNSVESWMYSGGAGSKNSWQATDETTTPIFLDLRPLSEILAPPFFTDPKVFNTLRPMVYQAVKQYVKENAGSIQTTSRFVPKRIAKPKKKLAQEKRCKRDISTYRRSINTDSRKEGGGAWARVRLPAAEHGTTKSMVAGCQAHSHGDGWQDLVIEVNSVCWKAATFQCKNGKWKHTFGWDKKKIFTRSKTGVTTTDYNEQQEILESGTGTVPWRK